MNYHVNKTLTILFCITMLNLSPSSFVEAKTKEKRIEQQLISRGAIKTGSNEFKYRSGIVFSLFYESNHLCTISVYLEKSYKDALLKEATDQGDGERNCMSARTYRDLLNDINKLQPIGSFIKNDPIEVISPAEWVSRSEEYESARVVIFEKDCPNPDPEIGCGINRFSVYYWTILRGKVEAMNVISHPIGEPPVYEYVIKLSGRKFNISKDDYEHINIGKSVTLRLINSGEWSEIISIK